MTKPILTTDRLILQPLEHRDLDLIISLFTDEEIMTYAGGAVSAESCEKEMPDYAGLGHKVAHQGVWTIGLRETGEKFGTFSLFPMPKDKEETIPTGHTEIGYFILKDYWGKGYVTEAAKHIIKFAFTETNLEQLTACVDDDNAASRNILQKVGMIEDGTIEAYGTILPFFTLNKQDWLTKNG
ncbi:GNAT family N-acetyltransferase [Curvivirga aplysinae]|uniref:GNAT family N-acetyltransferase n=1 Tax=Curvivirga aplysinae TaxID=2529852 RepID=UPI0012BCA36F|nr:GNAT family N-acetyltransferase [Curvivirga aplysinae]MTI10690.1 N-acetyltransferase [Curvivirga aplysinae]